MLNCVDWKTVTSVVKALLSSETPVCMCKL